MKKLVAVLLSAVLVLSTCCLPASAGTEKELLRYGGYTEHTIYINNIPYSATLSLEGSTSTGGRSVFYSVAKCVREHFTVHVAFFTVGTGYESYSGGEKTFSGTDGKGKTGYSHSDYVTYEGNDTPTGIKSINATGRLTTYNLDGSSQSVNFSAAVLASGGNRHSEPGENSQFSADQKEPMHHPVLS
ncbi:MAG: hypothetical protein IK014_00980 [Lachnospiraceae bacterium]|nr:hypothetical protein [Lachnospiraceae bacterium]